MEKNHLPLGIIELNFQPLRLWPKSIPSIICNGLLISGFNNNSKDFHKTTQQLEDALYDCYPQLTLPELARLYDIKQDLNWVIFCQKYGLKYSDNLVQTMKMILKIPLELQNWLSQKNFSESDLAPLKWYLMTHEFSDISPLLLHLTNSQLSKTQCVQTMEWALELLEMGSPLNDLLTPSQNWFQSIYKMRFPKTDLSDSIHSKRVQEFPWPKNIHAKWNRQGDQTSLEIKISAHDAIDFSNKFSKLAALKESVKEKIWNPIS